MASQHDNNDDDEVQILQGSAIAPAHQELACDLDDNADSAQFDLRGSRLPLRSPASFISSSAVQSNVASSSVVLTSSGESSAVSTQQLLTQQTSTRISLSPSPAPAVLPATSSATPSTRTNPSRPARSSATRSRQATARSRGSQNSESGGYFTWTPNDISRLVDIIYNDNQYQRVLLPGRLTAEQEKGLKTNKEVICGQIWQQVFPEQSSVGGAGRVKSKIRWLGTQYNNIKKSFSQTGAGILLRDMDRDHSVCIDTNHADSHVFKEY